MRYVFLALVIGATVVGAGWVALDEPIADDWRGDLLDLTPFSAIDVTTDGGDGQDRPDTKRKRRKRRGKGRTGAAAPSPGPASATSAPAAPSAPPPAAPPPPPGTPAPAEVHYQMGLAYLQQKKIPPAIAELKKCIGMNPKHAMAYRALGMAHSVMGKQTSAVKAFEKFVKLAPGHKDAAKVRAIIEAHQAGK